MQTGESVTYEPSKGTGFGHALRKRGAQRAWADVQAFYQACTEGVDAPKEIVLTAHRPTKWDNEALITSVLEQTLKAFGEPHEQQLYGGTMWPSGEFTQGGWYKWKRTVEQLIADLAYLDAGAPWPKAAIGPVELRFTQQFRWHSRLTEAARGASHPNVETAGGTFTLWLGRR